VIKETGGVLNDSRKIIKSKKVIDRLKAKQLLGCTIASKIRKEDGSLT
jgi:hypothetical protein